MDLDKLEPGEGLKFLRDMLEKQEDLSTKNLT